MRMRPAAATALLILTTAGAAGAQSPDPPRITANFGVGFANPLDADLSITPFAWQTAVRVRTARHLLIEASYGEWRHSETRAMTNVPIQGPGGSLGQVDRITEDTEQARRAIAFNVLGAWSSGPVTFAAGGGPGVMLYRRRFSQTFEGCHTAIVTCGSTSHEFNSGAFTVQATAGIDVTIVSRIGAFGEFRMDVPIEDPAGGQASAIAGVRVTIW